MRACGRTSPTGVADSAVGEPAEEIDHRLREIYRRREAGRGGTGPAGQHVVPRFYVKARGRCGWRGQASRIRGQFCPDASGRGSLMAAQQGGGRLRQLVRQYARARFFERMRDTMMTKDVRFAAHCRAACAGVHPLWGAGRDPVLKDMEELARVLSSASSPPEDDSNRMNYDAFCIARENAPERARRLFTASTFAKARLASAAAGEDDPLMAWPPRSSAGTSTAGYRFRFSTTTRSRRSTTRTTGSLSRSRSQPGRPRVGRVC